ncbi:MAG TPA: DUF3231 family protein [Clostridia bacterium]|nr:DUF3231 family protein [Clostridia bacterium]
MEQVQKEPLVLSEIAGLWNEYMSEMASIQLLKHFLAHVDDVDIKATLEYALEISKSHISEKTRILGKENIPLPKAFNDDDVDIYAPRLFSDSYYLFYLNNAASFGMEAYTVILRYISRSDVIEHFSKCMDDSKNLFNTVVSIQAAKGLLTKVPRVDVEKEPVFPNNYLVFKGMLIDNPRPLFAREVVNVFSGSLIDDLLKVTLTAFSQIAKSQEVRDYMLKGKHLFENHFKGFVSILTKERLPVSSSNDSFITVSKETPFSDKLLMYSIQELCYYVMIVDTNSVTYSLRSDFITHFIRYGTHIGKFIMDGIKIMIDNGWYEQPPQVIKF